ncbi:MAG: ethanolamine ammonia-lyase subunit EutB, partial [Gammaproteobacteria bacterium]|nr:ethanolamine ammonia-lyase subunit EutB [Gammaproteobacteria bacterium]
MSKPNSTFQFRNFQFKNTVGERTFGFVDLADLMAKATPSRSGDHLAGVAAQSAEERAIAQMTLADVPLILFLEQALVPYEEDEITRLILDDHDKAA